MTQYDKRVFEVFKTLAGKKFEDVLTTAQGLEITGKKPERALADALEHYGLAGAVK